MTSRVRAASRATKNTPSGKASERDSATATASRVFPDPPGPVSVTSRQRSSASIRCSSASSPSRPTIAVAWGGRWVRPPGVRSGGNCSAEPGRAQLGQGHRLRKVLEPVPSEVGEDGAVRQVSGDELPGGLGQHDLSAVRGGGDAGGEVDVDADVAVVVRGRLARCAAPCGHGAAHPAATGARPDRAAPSSAAVTPSSADGKTTKKLSPSVPSSRPPHRAKASRRIRRCASSTSAYPSPRARSTDVDPSMSLKSSVSVPVGSASGTRRP